MNHVHKELIAWMWKIRRTILGRYSFPSYTVHFAYFSLSVQYLARLSTWLQWIFFKNLSHNCIPFLLKLALQNNHKHLYCLNEHSLKSNTAAALSDVYVCALFTTIGKLWGLVLCVSVLLFYPCLSVCRESIVPHTYTSVSIEVNLLLAFLLTRIVFDCCYLLATQIFSWNSLRHCIGCTVPRFPWIYFLPTNNPF